MASEFSSLFKPGTLSGQNGGPKTKKFVWICLELVFPPGLNKDGSDKNCHLSMFINGYISAFDKSWTTCKLQVHC
jgi:hypothetical protein